MADSQPSFLLCLIRAIAISIICWIQGVKTFFGLIFCGWFCNIGNFFYTKSRKQKPKCLEGWNDKYIQLSVSSSYYMTFIYKDVNTFLCA